MWKKKGWQIKTLRPEEIFSSPNEFYTDEEIERYSKSSHMEQTQKKLTYRLIELMKARPPAIVIDLGCGVGYSTEFLQDMGFKVIGIDVNKKMLQKARDRNLNVRNVDMQKLEKEFGSKIFDYVISVSALQWITEKNDLKKVAKGIYDVTKSQSLVGIHFYPKSEKDLNIAVSIFSRAGFIVECIIDNPNSSRKRTLYLIMKKR